MPQSPQVTLSQPETASVFRFSQRPREERV